MEKGQTENNITKINRAEEVVPGTYFRRIRTSKSWRGHLTKDLLVLVTEVEGKKVSYSFPDYEKGDTHDFTSDLNSFLAEHRLEPNGKAERDAEFQEAVFGATKIAQEITAETDALTGIDKAFQPHALIGRDVSVEPGEDTTDLPATNLEQTESVSLARTGGQSQMLAQANEWIGNVAEKRNALSQKHRDLEIMRKRVYALQAEQKEWMDSLMRIKNIKHKLEEVIRTLQLYLGTGEEIVQLRNGKPCDANTPLVIRQLVLCMDEECALNSEHQGIDAYSMEQFDDWLLDKPENLQQILPEEKGIVCLKPRRYDKDYGGDSFVNAKMNVANKKTYILIRNGENIFRVCPEWEVINYFFPTKNEFVNAFVATVEITANEAKRRGISTADWSEYELKSSFGKKVKTVITPEDDEYEEVCEKIDQRMAYYSKALILLQGIVDRTGIFPEYQQIRLNLMDITQWTNYIRFIHDADPAFLLTTGLETFDEWLARTNNTLTVGDRIIGLYRKIESRVGHEATRVSPKNANDPDEFGLYTIEERTDQGRLIFRYARTDERYVQGGWNRKKREWIDGGYQPYTTRASFTIHKEDTEVIAYDAVTLEEMERFLTDRLSRPSYLTIFPLIKRVRNMKRVEREEEQPFIRLLMGEAMKLGYDLSEAELEKQVLAVIHWYKFKNKVHRSLAADENLAVRMCINELRLRHETNLQRERSTDEVIIEDLKTDQTLFIGMRQNLIVTLVRANEDHIFLHRIDYRKTRQGYTEVLRKEFYIPGREYNNWTSIYEHPDWETWPKGARVKDFLTPTQLRALIEQYGEPTSIEAAKRGMNYACKSRGYSFDKKTCCEWKRTYMMAITVNTDREVIFHYGTVSECEGKVRFARVSRTYQWKKAKKDEITVTGGRYNDWSNWTEDHFPHGWVKKDDEGNFIANYNEHWDPRKDKSFVYFLDIFSINEYMKRYREGKAINKRISDKQSFFHTAKVALTDHVNAAREQIGLQKYLDNYGDPLNWESFKNKGKNLGYEGVDYRFFMPLSELLGDLYVAGKITPEDVYGKTLREVVGLAIMHDPYKADETKAYELGSVEGVDQDSYIFLPHPAPAVEEEEQPEPEEVEADEEWEH